MEELWRFKFPHDGNLSYAPAPSEDRVFVIFDYHIWSLNQKHGFYYYKVPIVNFVMRALLPDRVGIGDFLFHDGLVYVLMRDRFGMDHRLIFDTTKMALVKGDPSPLVRKVIYIFKDRVRIERCMIDGRFREGVRAVDHASEEFLWNSSERIRPAIKYTEVVGDIIQVGEGIVIAQNYFSRRGKMPAGYSITSYHYRTGTVLWNMESFTYSNRLYPFVMAGGFMYITTGTVGGNKEGFLNKIDLSNGKIAAKIPFNEINSGVSGGLQGEKNLFFLGAGGSVIALEDKDA